MKKTLVATITSALVIGAFSTTFAAANPFSDVPTDHWAFDAVAKLAQEGVIEGYGDNTFRGDAHITRYEMAQMVAKAMSKDLSGADKATVDKLAAEFADELNNLGVRVANLEKKSDNVTFKGLLRLEGFSHDTDRDNGKTDEDHVMKGRLRLDMTAFVNDDWKAKARLEADTDLDNGSKYDDKVTAKRIYAEGPLFGSTAKLGKFGGFDNPGMTTGGLLLDAPVSGAEFTWKNSGLTAALAIGRFEDGDYKYNSATGTSDYAALQLEYGASDNLRLAAGYHNLHNSDAYESGAEDTNGIWTLGFDYKLSQDFTFGALYAASTAEENLGMDSDEKTAYTAQLSYKGAKSSVANSYGLWLAYRQVGELASMNSTYNGVSFGEKGVEFGVEYMLDKKIKLKGVYFNGEEITGGDDVEKIFGRLEFQF